AEHPVGPERHIRCHAAHTTLGRVATGPDDAGHVGAVSVAVVRVGIGVWLGLVGGAGGVGVVVVADEVVAHRDTVGGEAGAVPVAAEIGVLVIHAGVQDAHLDPLAGITQLALGDVRPGHGQGTDHLRLRLGLLLRGHA